MRRNAARIIRLFDNDAPGMPQSAKLSLREHHSAEQQS